METKTCSKCKVTFTLDNFYVKKSIKCGYRSACKDCTKAQGKKWKDANKEICLALIKKWSMKNRDRKLATTKKWYEENKERKLASNKLWRVKNRDHVALVNQKYYEKNKESCTESHEKWKKDNPYKVRAHSSRRRASKAQATPTWTSQIQKLQIDSLFNEAVNLELTTGIKYHIDHFHPLSSKYICGLHLPINLQLLTGSENCSKSNKFQPYVESNLDPENLKPWECFYPVLSIDFLESA